ncbi:MAG: hypothetical protein WDA07_05545 [Leucobacter sp.]
MVNLMRDLGYDENDPEVVEARAAAKREENLRTLAEAEAKNEFHPDRQPFNLYDARRLGYVRGFIAGRTSVTREQIANATCSAMDEESYQGEPCDACVMQAEVVVRLLRGEVADDAG